MRTIIERQVFSLEVQDESGGIAELSCDIPGVDPVHVLHLDFEGLPKPGTKVKGGEGGDILIGMRTSHLPPNDLLEEEEEFLAQTLGKENSSWKDSSLRVPPWVAGVVSHVHKIIPQSSSDTLLVEVELEWKRPVCCGDLFETSDGQIFSLYKMCSELPNNHDDLWAGEPSRMSIRKIKSAQNMMFSRSIGPYSNVTQQPLKGKHAFGGQLVGLPEISGALKNNASTLCFEWISAKSDCPLSRIELYESLMIGEPLYSSEIPKAVKLLEAELRAMTFNISFASSQLEVGISSSQEIIEFSSGEVTEELPSDTMLMTERGFQFGHIELMLPLFHPLFINKAAELLGLNRRDFENVIEYKSLLSYDSNGAFHVLPVTSAQVFDAGPLSVIKALKKHHHSRGINFSSSAFTKNRDVGIFACGTNTKLNIHDVLVSDTQSMQSSETGGRGLEIRAGASVHVSRSVFTNNKDIGIAASETNTKLKLHDVLVSNTKSQQSDGLFGRGLNILSGASVEVSRSVLTNNKEVGIYAGGIDAKVALSDVIVADTLQMERNNTAGIGIGSYGGAHIEMNRFVVTRNALCGVQVALGGDYRGNRFERGGEITLSDGIISHNEICGINVQTDTTNLDELNQAILYFENNYNNLDSSVLLCPESSMKSLPSAINE